MIVFILIGIVGYVVVKIWAAIIPTILEKRFLNNKGLVKDIRDMHDSYDRLEKRLEDYCKKHPESCKDIKPGNVYLP